MHQLLFWTICLVKTVLAACYKPPVPSESKFSAEMIELMGDLKHRADVQAVERGKAGGHKPPLFPLPGHILAFFSSGSHEPPLYPLASVPPHLTLPGIAREASMPEKGL